MCKYEVTPTLKGLSITDGKSQYLFKNKLFSLSSEIVDNNGLSVATLKRSGWWYLSFLLETTEDTYKLEHKWGEMTISSTKTGESFHSNFSIEFYTKLGRRVTEFSRVKKIGRTYSLAIHNSEHRLALLMASCLIFKTTIEHGSM